MVLGQKLASLMVIMEANAGPQNSMPLIVTGASNEKACCLALHKEEGLWSSSQAVIFLLLFPEDQNLCVVQRLKEYEKWTEAFWPRTGKLITPIFLSRIQPH